MAMVMSAGERIQEIENSTVDQRATRRRLVEAATEVFAEQGYDGTRVQEIARRAGLTTGAIYGNFSGKAELLAHAIDAASTPELDRLLGKSGLTTSAAALLVEMGERVLDAERGAGNALLFEAFVAARRDPDVKAALSKGLAKKEADFHSLIDIGKADGSIDPDVDSDAVATLALAIAMGFLLFEMLDVEHPTNEGWSDLIRRIVGSITTGNVPGDEISEPVSGSPSRPGSGVEGK